jgi:hypothetical protein
MLNFIRISNLLKFIQIWFLLNFEKAKQKQKEKEKEKRVPGPRPTKAARSGPCAALPSRAAISGIEELPARSPLIPQSVS